MKFSYNWLQSYFDAKLPPPDKLSELFTMHVFEVESLEKNGDDTIFDLKVLPDRACYALSHRGVAREIAAILGIELKNVGVEIPLGDPISKLEIRVEDSKLCPRYIGVLIEGVTIGETPELIKSRLSSVGQRSINSVVDIVNYLMLDVGQPLHAFDVDKIEGVLTVRLAKAGEKMTTLDNKEVTLDGTELLIADDKGPLGIAGIKGGKRAEITTATKRLILEAANFDASTLRHTSTKIGIRTDASKRFENKIPLNLCHETMGMFVVMLLQTQKGAKVVGISDVHGEFSPDKKIQVSEKFITDVLGVAIPRKEIESIFGRLSISFIKDGEEYTLTIPTWRLDLTIPEDIAEEVGRLYGYENLKPVLPPNSTGKPSPLKSIYWQEKIKDFLLDRGFSEVFTYSFRKDGDMEIIKSLASDKNFLRKDLTQNIAEALEHNLVNAPLLGLSEIKIFEIGKVFPSLCRSLGRGEPKTGEHTALAIGITAPKNAKGKKVNEAIREVRDALVGFLGAPVSTVCTIDDSGGVILISGNPVGTINSMDGIMEINLDSLIEVLPEPVAWDKSGKGSAGEYKPISQYPFIVRDVALYVNPTDSFADIVAIIETLSKEGKLSNLEKKPTAPFDEFVNEKLGKKSFAFRLIFQSHDRTLTDTEVNAEMESLYATLTSRGWQIR